MAGSCFRVALGNSAFGLDMLGERSTVLQGDEQTSPGFGLNPENAIGRAVRDANMRIAYGGSKSDFLCGRVVPRANRRQGTRP
jgi:hypothetical protein